MCMVIPAAYFAGITTIGAATTEEVVTAAFRDQILKVSRGMAIIMLLVYIGSRIYLVNPPGEDNSMDVYAAAGGHEAFRHEELKLKEEPPKVGPWFCLGLLIVLVGLIAATAEWLVDSIEEVVHGSGIKEEYVWPFSIIGFLLTPCLTGGSVLSSCLLYPSLEMVSSPLAMLSEKCSSITERRPIHWLMPSLSISVSNSLCSGHPYSF